MEIELPGGQHTIIDDMDYEKVSSLTCYVTSNGYVHGNLRIRSGVWKKVLLHRFILDAPKNVFVDHVNRNKLDNTRANLRYATPSQNQGNKLVQSNNLTGYKGVTWDKSRGKWKAAIYKMNKRHHLGMFNSLEDAVLAYNHAAVEYFGEYARVNDVAAFRGVSESEIAAMIKDGE